jgi:hypothetical protein
VKLADWPDWVQRLYWKWHGPIGNPQPRAEGLHGMSAGGVIQFLIIEGVLFCVLMLALWGVKKLITDGEVAKWVSIILILIIGGAMLLKLLGFAGIL